MRAKYMFLCVMVATVGFWAWANQAPQAQTTAIYAQPGEAVEVILAALDPDGDPLEFELLDLPAVGTLLGAPPRLTYVASPGFAGSVRLSFRVRDPYGAFDIGLIEIRVNTTVQRLRIEPKAPSNSALLALTEFLVSQGVRTWYVADFDLRSFSASVLPFFFAGGEKKARVFIVGPAEAPVLRDLGELKDYVLWVDMRESQPGLYFFLVLSGENAFSYPVRIVQPPLDRKLAYASRG